MKAKFFSAVAVAAVAAFGIYYWFSKNGRTEIAPFIYPPALADEIPVLHFSVNPDRDTLLLCLSGSFIRVPSGAFSDSAGSLVHGTVEIVYREFRNTGDVIVSGVPMVYDSLGKNFFLQTAGMFELTGYSDGKTLSVKPGKSIEVNFRSDNPGTNGYNQYFLNIAARNWQYLKPDEPTVISLLPENNPIEISKEKISSLSKKFPQKPQKINAAKHHLSVAVDENEFPELALYSDVIFEVDEQEKNYDSKRAEETWNSAVLEKTANGKYRITFEKTGTRYPVLCYPVIPEKGYPEALKKYEKLFAGYQRAFNQRKTSEKTDSLSLASRLVTFLRKAESFIFPPQIIPNLQNNLQTENSDIVYRTFQVEKFGMWNSDMPQNAPDGPELLAEFRHKNGNRIVTGGAGKIFLIDKDLKMLYSFYEQKIRVNPKHQNFLLVISSENGLYYFPENDFEKMEIKSSAKNTMALHSFDEKKFSSKKIMELIGIDS